MLKHCHILSFAAVSVLGVLAQPAAAGITVYEEGDKYIEIGGRIQIQYLRTDPDEGDSEDELFFRRLRPYIEGSVTKNWEGKIQFDVGKAEDTNEVAVKDAYMKYKGSVNVTIGNQKPPFSREFLTSSKRQQLVERTFVGDHNFGSPDRMLGIKVDGENESKKVAWALSFGEGDIDPDADKLDFDSPANKNSDFNQGWLTVGRLDFHPNGALKFEQGDFKRDETKYTLSIAAFVWSNDDDNNTNTAGGISTSSSKPDVDSSEGFEVSGGLRSGGFSIDAEYQLVSADTVDPGFTGGVFLDGTTDLDILAIEGGYMLPSNNFEIVAGYESLDADNYEDSWDRTSFGFNYFWNKYKLKIQLTQRFGENIEGVAGQDLDETFLQMQFVF